jgi:uncharacterized beta-barrel protein YwiB (DUF1934 family)
MQNVTISTEQYDKEQLLDTITIKAQGKVYEKNDAIHVVYEEVDEDTKLKATSRLKITKDQVEVNRSGNSISKMIFKNSEKYECDYKTAYGLLNIDIFTNSLKIDIKEDIGIDVDINYELIIKNLFDATNKMKINIEFLK